MNKDKQHTQPQKGREARTTDKDLKAAIISNPIKKDNTLNNERRW